MYEACFRVSLKHASLWAQIFRKLRLKPLQMEMILGERGGSRGEAVYEACFRVSLKHASLWAEIFNKLRLLGLLSYLRMYLCNACRTAANRILRSTSAIPTARKRCCFWVRGLTLFFLATFRSFLPIRVSLLFSPVGLNASKNLVSWILKKLSKALDAIWPTRATVCHAPTVLLWVITTQVMVVRRTAARTNGAGIAPSGSTIEAVRWLSRAIASLVLTSRRKLISRGMGVWSIGALLKTAPVGQMRASLDSTELIVAH